MISDAFFLASLLDCFGMMQTLYQLHRNIDFLLLEAFKGACNDERETIDRFWNMVDKNPKMLPEMRKTHGAILCRAVNGAMWESQMKDEKEWVKTFVSHLKANLKSPVRTEDSLLNEYIQLRAHLINSTFFKSVVCTKISYGKPPYTPYESLLAKIWGLDSSPLPEIDGELHMQNLRATEKALQRFIKKHGQPDNIV